MTNRELDLFISNQAIYRYYYHRLRAIALAEFEYTNFPETCNALYFERKLYDNGVAGLYVPDGADFILSTAIAPVSRFDGYGIPLEIVGIDFNGRQYPSRDFVVCYDSTDIMSGAVGTTHPIKYYLDLYARLLWECHQTFRSNLRQQITPYVLVGTKESKLAIKNIMSQVYGYAPYIILKKGMDLDTIKAIGMDVDFKGMSILQSLEFIWKQAMAFLGISTGTTKRERELTGEIAMNRMGDMMSLQTRLYTRVIACNEANRRWGLNMAVNLGQPSTDFNPLPTIGEALPQGGEARGNMDSERDGADGGADGSGDEL